MALFNKLNNLAKNIGDMASDTIETTKMNSKLAQEKLAANEELLKIGQHYYDLFLQGHTDPDTFEFCQAAKAHFDAADQIQADIDRIKQGNNAQPQNASPAPQPSETPQGIFCTNCGASLPAGTKFCNQCGQKLE